MKTIANTNWIKRETSLYSADKKQGLENSRWFRITLRIVAVLGWIIILSLWFTNMTHGQTSDGSVILIVKDSEKNVYSERALQDMPGMKEVEAETLLSFTTKYVNGTTYLKWQVQCESENGIFIIERSRDNECFVPIGVKQGIGVPLNQPIMYSWKDVTPKAEMAYYRISKEYKDGTYYKSNISKVDELLTENSLLVSGN